MCSDHRSRLKQERHFTSSIICLRCPVLLLATILTKHQITSVTALMIDAEGYEPQVFQSFDLNQTRPELMQFEHVNLIKEDEREIRERLIGHGYRMSRGRWESTAIIANARP